MAIQDNMLQIQVAEMHRSKSRSLFSTRETSPSPDGMAVGKRAPRVPHSALKHTPRVCLCLFGAPQRALGFAGESPGASRA